MIVRKTFPQVYALEHPKMGRYWLMSARKKKLGMSITEGENLPVEVETAWRRQMTNAKGFERIYVAALRSVGVPARLNPQGRAEFWTPTGWQSAPRPLIESFVK